MAELFLQISVSLDGFIEDRNHDIEWMTSDMSFDEMATATLRSIRRHDLRAQGARPARRVVAGGRRAEGWVACARRTGEADERAADVRADARRFHFFSAVTVLGTPQDITVQELLVESFFPLDDATAESARRLLG
jgi:hypothetical protein